MTQIPWGTIITTILPKSNSYEEMLEYIKETYKNGWSRSVILNQFKLKSYERSLLEPTTSSNFAMHKYFNLIHEFFKDTYVLDFIDSNQIKKGKTLNKARKNVLSKSCKLFVMRFVAQQETR